MERTSNYRERLVESNKEFRGSAARIRFVNGYQRSGMPPFIQNYLEDCGRKEPRNQHPLATYEPVAQELVRCGVPVTPVLEPLELIGGRIMSAAAPWLPSLDECSHSEENSNSCLNHAQIVAASRITPDVIDQIIEAGCQQIASTKQLVAVAQALRNKVAR